LSTVSTVQVLSLVNDYTAVALKYAADGHGDAFSASTHVVLADMGSTSTKLSVVTFHKVPHAEKSPAAPAGAKPMW
jgi:molecular chaperone DnaK (HSP70)